MSELRFTLMTGLGGVEHYPEIARVAEQCGFHSLAIPDSLFYPEITESDYPYMSTEAVRQALDGVPVLEPLVAIASMAAITTRLRFYPAVMKVPVRQPLVLAKALSSLAVVSGNRLSLGAGLSPWKEDFSYNGVEFNARGALMDQCLQIIRGAMSGDYYEYHSEHYDIGRMKMAPVPDQPMPILIGGHARPALRRAARYGDGWVSANTDYQSLQGMIATLQAFREEYDTVNREGFEIHAFDMAAREPDDFGRLEELGVTDACVTPWNPYDPDLDLQMKLDAVQAFARKVLDP